MKYKIRTAVPTDEGKIRELFLEMLRTIYHTDDVKGYGDGDLDRFWSESPDRIYVAEDGQVVAFLSVEIHHDPVDHIYLDDFSVMAAYRNKGIGSALVRAAEAYAERIGSRAVLLHVEKTNTSAMRFYERSGYSVFRDDGNRFLLKKEMEDLFCDALREKDTGKLLSVPKSDLHNHSTKGCRRAVEALGLSEVHHGIAASTSKETMRFLADNHIQLNVCPSSNVMLGYVKDYSTHPIRTLVENEVRVTINTDDLLIFDSTIENEYLKLYRAGTLSVDQLDEIRRAGLGTGWRS